MKKYFNFKYYFAALVFSCCITSCQVVELEPTTIISDEQALVTLNDYQAALNAVYGNLRAVYITYINTQDVTSDDVKIGSNNLGQGAFLYNYNYVSGEGAFLTVWAESYRAIFRINKILEKIPTLNVTSPADQATRNRIQGECLVLRAMLHFDLLRYFAPRFAAGGNTLGVPYVNSLLAPGSTPVRNTQDECYTRLLADLDAGRALLPTTGTDINIIRPVVADAIRARIHLYRGEWAQAVDYATRVINNAGVSLATGVNFTNMWRPAENAGEILFKIKFLQGQGSLGGTYWGEQNDTNFFEPTADMLGLFDTVNDVRFAAYFLIRSTGSGNVIVKYRNNSSDFGRVDIKLFRLAEMFLIRAEANARNGQEPNAMADLNTLRAARITGYVAPSPLTGTALINAILVERRKELAYEGHRFMDLKRLALPINRNDCNAASPSACTISADNFRILYPIPQQEILANPSMQQNPGY